MKMGIMVVLITVVLLGCSKEQSQQPQVKKASPSAVKASVPATDLHVVETDVAKDRKEIKGKAWALLDAKDYDGLERLAAKYRTSKECFPDGLWKLDYVYEGLEVSDVSVEPAWEAKKRQIQDWIKAKPESVTAQVALARFLADYAWHARGAGYASSVKEQDWQTFARRLQQAAQVLSKAKLLDEKCPVLWLTLQKVALGLQAERSQYDKIFEEAIQTFPDYSFFYRSRAVYLLPRWHGEDGELEKDLQAHADKLGGEAGDKLYARVVWSLHRYAYFENVFSDNHLSWDRTERGIEAILKEFPDSIAVCNEAAYLAGLGKAPESAQKYLLMTKGQVDLDSWDSVEHFQSLWQWAFPE